MAVKLLDTYTQAVAIGGDWSILNHPADTGQGYHGPIIATCNFQVYNNVPPHGAPSNVAHEFGALNVGPHIFKVSSGLTTGYEVDLIGKAYRAASGYDAAGLIVRADNVFAAPYGDWILLKWIHAGSNVEFHLMQFANIGGLVRDDVLATIAWANNVWRRLRVHVKYDIFQAFFANPDGSSEVQIGVDKWLGATYVWADAAHTYVGIMLANAPDVEWDDLSAAGPGILLGAGAAGFSVPQGDPAPAPAVVTVHHDADTGDFDSLACSVTYGSGAGWCTPTLDGVTTPTNLNIAVNPAGLAVGVYTATVHVTSSEAANSPQDVVVTLTITTGPTIDLAPDSFFHSLPLGSAPPVPDTVAVTNSAGGTLTGLSAVALGGVSWVTPSLDSGTAPTTLRLTYDPTGLGLGLHTATIRVTSAKASNSPQDVSVQLELTGVVGCDFADVVTAAQEESEVQVENVTTERYVGEHLDRVRGELLAALVRAGEDVDASDQTYAVAASITLNPVPARIRYLEARAIADGSWVPVNVESGRDPAAVFPPRAVIHDTQLLLVDYATEWTGVYDQVKVYGATIAAAGSAIMVSDLAPNYAVAPLFCRCLALSVARLLAELDQRPAAAIDLAREYARVRLNLVRQVAAQYRVTQRRFREGSFDA